MFDAALKNFLILVMPPGTPKESHSESKCNCNLLYEFYEV